MTKEEILDRFCERLRSSSDHVIKHRRFYASKFLDFAGEPPWGEMAVIKYMKELDAEGYSKGTQRTIYGITKTVFGAARSVADEEKVTLASSIDPSDPTAMAQLLKLMTTPPVEWPMPKRSAPRVEDKDIVAPILSVEDTEKMITAAREGKLEPPEAAFVALSTTFGLRREELGRVRAEHIENGTIFVDTAKGGTARIHHIPEEIMPVIAQYGFDRAYSLFQLSWHYHRIEFRSGIEPREGTGWHSPRRALDTALLDQLPMPAVKLFLRWKTKGSSDMPLHYYSKDLGQNDREVFAVHPFLGFWR